MRAFILKPQHFGGQFFSRQGPVTALLKFLADLVILAEHTAEIAPGKKDGPGTSCPGNRGFFSEMEPCMGNPDSRTDPAKTGFPC